MLVTVPDEFMNFLRTEEQRATDVSLNDKRAAALRAYRGEKYGDEEEGRSQAVTRDVSEVVDKFVVGILGTILSGGKVVEFETEPEKVETGEQDEQGEPETQTVDYGAQATAAVAYQFLRKQKGYRILHDSLKAGLLEMTGIVATYVEKRPPVPTTVEAPNTMIETGPDGHTIDGHSIREAVPIDPDWQPGIMSEMWRVTYDKPQPPIVRDEAIPNEWFLVAPDVVDLDEGVYCGHKTPKTISDLVGMGYDYADLITIWDGSPDDTIVETARDADRSQTRQSIGSREGSAKQRWLTVEYPLYDLNGDGLAERLCVHRIGQNVFAVIEVDEQPYSGWSPFPMQHRFVGESLADKTQDIQRINSVLLRQALNSLYQSTSPRWLVPEEGMTPDTIDDMLNPHVGSLVRYKGGVAPSPLLLTDTSGTAFSGMEMMAAQRESRTGVTRQSQGINPDVTNRTASGLAMNIEQAQEIMLYVVRNFAELLVAQMFAKRYRLMRAFVQPFRMKIDGQYETIDPSRWPDEIDMEINVGLGTGSKTQKLSLRAQLAEYQSQAVAAGLPGVTPKHIANNMWAMIEDAAIGVKTDYWGDPDDLPSQPEKPDPETVKAQADAQTQQAKDQQAHQQAMGRLQLQQEEQQASSALKADANAQDIAAKREKSALDLQLARDRADFEARLAVNRQAFEENLAERRFAFDQDMAKRKVAMSGQDDSVPSYRPGGSLAE